MARQFVRLAQVILSRSATDSGSGRKLTVHSTPSIACKPEAPEGGAFAHLFAAVEKKLRVQLRRILGNTADADEVAQEAWLRAWDRRSTIRDENPQAFIFQTARNLAIERKRRAIRRPDIANNDAVFAAPDELTPERVVLGRLELAAVRSAMQRLPDRQRRALELHHDGKKVREIAGTLNCSPMTAWRHLRLGLDSLHVAREGALPRTEPPNGRNGRTKPRAGRLSDE